MGSLFCSSDSFSKAQSPVLQNVKDGFIGHVVTITMSICPLYADQLQGASMDGSSHFLVVLQ